MRMLIVGAGAVGFHLARRLGEEGHEMAIVDVDAVKVRHAADHLDVLAVQGNGARASVLAEAGLARVDALIAVSGNEEVNLLACLAAHRQGVRVKAARVRNPEEYAPGNRLSRLDFGIDLLIGPERECAWEIYQLLAAPAATDLAPFAEGRVHLLGIRVREGAPLAGRPLAEVGRELRGQRFVVAAVVREGTTEMPTGDTVLGEGDRVFLVGPSGGLDSMALLAGHEPAPLSRVMIAGGSDEAVHLTQHLQRHGVECTIFERDRRRSRELAEELPGALVLHGDATDIELLEMEGVEGVDGFVATTDRDEVNLLVALLAKSAGAARVIPLLHRTEYMNLVDRVGLDAAVSPRISAANAILRMVWEGSATSVATVKGSRAEAVEAVIGRSAPIAGLRLREASLPRGAVLGALVRKGSVITPRGHTRIRSGDEAVFFVLPEAVPALRRLLG